MSEELKFLYGKFDDKGLQEAIADMENAAASSDDDAGMLYAYAVEALAWQTPSLRAEIAELKAAQRWIYTAPTKSGSYLVTLEYVWEEPKPRQVHEAEYIKMYDKWLEMDDSVRVVCWREKPQPPETQAQSDIAGTP